MFHVFLTGSHEFSTVQQMYVGSANTFEEALENHATYYAGNNKSSRWLSEVDVLMDAKDGSGLVFYACTVERKETISPNLVEKASCVVYADGTSLVYYRKRSRRISRKERLEQQSAIDALLKGGLQNSVIVISEWVDIDDEETATD